jgi:hypothetical protein
VTRSLRRGYQCPIHVCRLGCSCRASCLEQKAAARRVGNRDMTSSKYCLHICSHRILPLFSSTASCIIFLPPVHFYVPGLVTTLRRDVLGYPSLSPQSGYMFSSRTRREHRSGAIIPILTAVLSVEKVLRTATSGPRGHMPGRAQSLKGNIVKQLRIGDVMSSPVRMYVQYLGSSCLRLHLPALQCVGHHNLRTDCLS